MKISLILSIHCLITVHGFSYSNPLQTVIPRNVFHLNGKRRIIGFPSSLPFHPSTQMNSSKFDPEYNNGDFTRTRSKRQRDLIVEQLNYPSDEDEDDYDEYTYEEEYQDNNDENNIYAQEDNEYDNDYDESDEYDIQSSNPRGNFWSNPPRSLDSYNPSRKRRSTRTRQRQRELVVQPTRRGGRESSKRMRKTFRSGNPPPPNIIKEFYDKLFWYGFDADETISAADRTMFGGTKGKFNGLNLLEDVNTRDDSRGRTSNRSRRNKSFAFFDDDDDDEYYDDDDDEYDQYDEYEDYEEDYIDELEGPTRNSQRGTLSRRKNVSRLSLRLPSSKMDKNTMQRRRPSSPRTISRKRRFNIDDWFDEEDEDKPKRDESDTSPLINMLDKVFQIDPNEVKYQADDYNRRIGLDKQKNKLKSRMGSKSTPKKRTRKGYAYPYDEDNDDDLYEIIEIDPTQDIDDNQKEAADIDSNSQDINDVQKNGVESKLSKDVNVIDVEATVTTPISKVEDKGERRTNSNRNSRKQTWEDRAASYERIPPKGVMAWGPDGEMDVDARTYAAMCAMEEIENAKTVFSTKEEAVNEAEQNLIQLKK
jgi:hypothetical protein